MTNFFSMLKKYPLYMILMCYSSMTYADIFKWVDGNGRTHYSDTPLRVGNSNVEKLKISSPNISSGHNTNLYNLSKVNWGGDGPETDKKQCALARDILSGAAKHSNGVVTDAYDIKVAQRDLSKFCH
jgi:hypothetical protein